MAPGPITHASATTSTLMMTKGRLEAFSDGVIAIAATLLVLNLKVPTPGAHSLGHALAEQWPSYAAYATSFLTIGIIWINHHITIERLRGVDQSVLIINLLLLMCVGILPWTTALLAEYLRRGSGQGLAAAIYAALAVYYAFPPPTPASPPA